MRDQGIQIDHRAEIVVLTPEELDARITLAVEGATDETRRELDHMKAAGAVVTFVLFAVMAWIWYRSEPATLKRMETRQADEHTRAEERHREVMASHAAFMGTLAEHTSVAADRLMAIDEHVASNTTKIQRLERAYGPMA
jgi:hypothetical protein